MKGLFVRLGSAVLVALMTLSPAAAGASGPVEASSLLEVSVKVAGESVIRNALVEVAHGVPARVATYEDEERTTGFEIELRAETPQSLADQGAVLVSAGITRISAGERTSVANADVGVLPGKPATLQLKGSDTPVELEVLLKGQKG